MDFVNIQTQVQQHYKNIPVMPLKLSSVFDSLFEQESSIKSLIKQSGLNKYHYKEVQQQFDALYDLIDNQTNHAK